MARCEQGYLCDVCGDEVHDITESDLVSALCHRSDRLDGAAFGPRAAHPLQPGAGAVHRRSRSSSPSSSKARLPSRTSTRRTSVDGKIWSRGAGDACRSCNSSESPSASIRCRRSWPENVPRPERVEESLEHVSSNREEMFGPSQRKRKNCCGTLGRGWRSGQPADGAASRIAAADGASAARPGPRGRVDASDIVQDVLWEASRRLSDYLRDAKLPFHLWLRELAKDHVIDAHRRHRKAQRRSVDRERPLAAEFADRSSLDLAGQLRDPELTPAAATSARNSRAVFCGARSTRRSKTRRSC